MSGVETKIKCDRIIPPEREERERERRNEKFNCIICLILESIHSKGEGIKKTENESTIFSKIALKLPLAKPFKRFYLSFLYKDSYKSCSCNFGINLCFIMCRGFVIFKLNL